MPPALNAQNHFNPIGDLSNAQFGALGMWALADAGIDVRPEYWQATDRFGVSCAAPTAVGPTPPGGGRGFNATPPTEAMGVAGIASLYIAQEFVDKTLHTIPKPDKNLDLGLAWLNDTFHPDPDDFYYLYAVEPRSGLASGLKFFGTRRLVCPRRRRHHWLPTRRWLMEQPPVVPLRTPRPSSPPVTPCSSSPAAAIPSSSTNSNTTAHGTPARAMTPR